MHMIECYSVTSGAKIGSCHIHEEPIELPKKPYITFHPHNPKGPSRQYHYWDKVIDKLKNNNNFSHEIIQIGGANDEKYNVNTDYLGKTNYHSLAYLIKNADMHIGFDSFPMHLASHYQRKIVAIFVYYLSNVGPFFSKPEDCVLLEPNRKKLNLKPVFANVDPFNQINTIDHNQIYKAIITLLNI